MMNHQPTQQHNTNQKKHHLADAATTLFDHSTQAALLVHHWNCTGCGTVHVRRLPEECVSCGATALEFQYIVPGEMGLYA